MNKSVFCALLFLFCTNFYISQNPNDNAYMFDGKVKLVKLVESTSIIGNIDNGLFIEINIKNKNYKFLVDTGTSASILNDESFKNIFNSNKKIKVYDAVGNDKARDLFYLDFRIGENQFSDFAFIKYDLSNFFKVNCLKFDGIIGANVLRKLNWKFVKAENKLSFSKNSFSYEGFDIPAKLQWAGSIPVVELKINDYKFLGIIDTGQFGTFIIPKDIYIKNFGFGTYYNSTKGKGNPISTINGSQKLAIKKALLENFSLQNYDFSKYEVILADNVLPNIGNKIILENGFIFNFLNNEIAFGKNDVVSRYSILPKIKICKSEENKNQVELCFFWDEPQNRKLKVGDQIIKINSYNTENVTDEEFCNLVKYISKENKPIKLILKRRRKQYEQIVN